MRGEMLRLSRHRVIGGQRIALHPAHIREAQLSRQIRVFPKILFHPAPARVAGHVKHRAKNHVHAIRARLDRDGRTCFSRQLRIPSRRQIDALREDGLIVGHESVQAFFNKNRGNSQTARFNDIGLHSVVELRLRVNIMYGVKRLRFS